MSVILSKASRLPTLRLHTTIGRFILLSATLILAGFDYINLNDTPSLSRNQLLLDGDPPSSTKTSDIPVGITFTTNPIKVSDLNNNSGPKKNEIIAFTRWRAMGFKTPVDWSDIVAEDVNFLPLIKLHMTIWIVEGDYEEMKDKAKEDIQASWARLILERTGVILHKNFVEFKDSTKKFQDGTTNDHRFASFECGTGMAMKIDMQNKVGKDSGRINIYYVDNVRGNPSWGDTCQDSSTGVFSNDFVAMGKETHKLLLAHELGHNFQLSHFDGHNYQCEGTNIMHSDTRARLYLTEGQIFRAHATQSSALNSVYSDRQGEETRDCPHATSNDQCPKVDGRLWSDSSRCHPNF